MREFKEKRGLGRVFFRLSLASILLSCRVARFQARVSQKDFVAGVVRCVLCRV
nr:hypothetical protein [uncultured Cupriavidus sp.]